MAYNGSGTFVLVSGNPVITGTTISSTWANNTLNDIATGLSTAITKDGQTTPTANISMGGYKITGVGAPTTNGDALRFENIALMGSSIQSQTYTYFTTGGTTTAYTLTPTPALGSLVAGQRFNPVFNAANTTETPTLAISGFTAKNLKIRDSTGAKIGPFIGALAANWSPDVLYDGTDYVVLNAPASRLLLQEQSLQTGAVATGTTQIPFDDTIPQQSGPAEGDQYLSVTITPKSATSILEISVLLQLSSTANAFLTAALFQDSTASAIAAGFQYALVSECKQVLINYRMTSGTTSATTFKVRAGANAAGTTTFNGLSSARIMGGVASSYITVKEYLP